MANCDYGIMAVHYDKDKEYIVSVKMGFYKENELWANYNYTRIEVIEKLQNNRIIYTIAPKTNKLGELVNIFNNKWIRTNPNDEKRDNLGELEEY